MTPDPRTPEFARLASRSLVVLTLINLVNYLDRYVVSVLGVSLTEPAPSGLGLSHFQFGLLLPAFMVVMSMTAGVFGALAERVPRPKLVAAGVAIWSLATALGGLAGSFLGLFAARALVGVGEAAYGTIAPALLADYFPPAKRGRVFAIFFAAIPLGAALGFIVGGKVDEAFGWRAAFYVAGLPGLLLALLALRLQDPPRGGLDEPGGGDAPASALAHAHAAPKGSWREVYAPLVRMRLYRLVVLGYAFATFAAGGLAMWMPTFLEKVRGLSGQTATVWLGLITAGTALSGTIVGGWAADRIAKRRANGHVWFCGVSTMLAAPFCLVALTATTPAIYWTAIVFGQLFLFASTGPVNLAIVNAVRPGQRVAAVALSILAIHMLGDVPSPPLIGLVSDHTSLNLAILIVPVFVALAGGTWLFASSRRVSAPPQAVAEPVA